VTFGVGASEMKIGVGEGIDDRIRLQIPISGKDVPIPAVEQNGITEGQACLEPDIAALIGAKRIARGDRAAVVDGMQRLDPVLVEAEIDDEVAVKDEMQRGEIHVDLRGDVEFLEVRRQSEILKQRLLIGRLARIDGQKIADGEQRVALLLKAGPAVVRVAGSRRNGREARAGELSFNRIEVVVGGPEFDGVVAVCLPIDSELRGIEPLVATLDLVEGVVGKIEGAGFDRKGTSRRNDAEVFVYVGLKLAGGTVEIDVLVPDEIGIEPRIGETA